MNTTAAATPAPAKAKRAPEHGTHVEPEHEAPRDAVHAKPRVRSRKSTINDNPFDIPANEIPEGSSYEWKRWANVGEENPFYIASMRSQGWEPVDPKRHPNWVPPGYDKPFIIRDGLILMERPMELTNEARAESRQLANQQTREAEQRLGLTPKDTMTRDDVRVKPRVVREMMRPLPIEE